MNNQEEDLRKNFQAKMRNELFVNPEIKHFQRNKAGLKLKTYLRPPIRD